MLKLSQICFGILAGCAAIALVTVAAPPKDNSTAVVSKELASFSGSVHGACASPDARRFAITVRNEKKQVLIVDGKVVAEPEVPPEVFFSADSKRVGFSVDKGRTPDGRLQSYYSCIDGREIQNASFGQFSPDSKHAAWVSIKPTGRVLALDGRESATFQVIECITFSPNSSRVAFAGLKNSQWSPILDGQAAGPSFEAVRDLIFSADSKHLAYIGLVTHNDKRTFCVVQDGKPGPFYDYILDQPLFSPDSRHFAYCALKDIKTFLVLDGKESEISSDRPDRSANDPWKIAFSPDSKSIAYCKNNRTIVQTDGVEKDVGGRYHFSCAFSPDSQTFACCVMKAGRSTISLNGTTGKSFDTIHTNSFHFSPDSKHFAFVGDTDHKSCVVIDGQEGEPFDVVLPVGSRDAPFSAFTADNAVEYLAIKDNKLHRVHVPLLANP